MTKNWDVKTIGEVCEVVGGGTPKTAVPEFWSDDIVWVTPKDLGKLDTVEIFDTNKHISHKGLKKSSAKLLPAGSVVMSSRAPIGYVAIAGVDLATNQGCRNFVCGDKIYNKYLYYFLFANTALLNSLGEGATFREISGTTIKGINIPLPQIIEQKRLVKILDEKLESIEKLKKVTQDQLASVKELFESRLNEVFDIHKCSMTTLNEISENLDGKRIPITKSIRTSGNIPYYGASGLVDYVKDYIFDEDLLLISEDGANLSARTYPIAFSVSGKTWVNNHAHVLRFKQLCTQRFIEYYINSISIAEYVTGAAQPKLNQRLLNVIPVPNPELDKQEQIVKELDELSEKTRKLKAIYLRKIADLEELKKSYLNEAFSGKL